MRARPTRSCEWTAELGLKARAGTVDLDLEEVRTCTEQVIEERRVRVVRERRPDTSVVVVEGALTLGGAGVVVWARDCSSTDLHGCVQQAEIGFIALLVAIPAGIATVVDLAKYETRTSYETDLVEEPPRTSREKRRPAVGVVVSLVLDDGRALDTITDAAGRAQLVIPDTFWGELPELTATIHAGEIAQRVRISREPPAP